MDDSRMLVDAPMINGRTPDVEMQRLRRLSAVIYNYLGLTDPDDVGRWIAGARDELMTARERAS